VKPVLQVTYQQSVVKTYGKVDFGPEEVNRGGIMSGKSAW